MDLRERYLRRQLGISNEGDLAIAIIACSLIVILFGLVLGAKPLFHYLASG